MCTPKKGENFVRLLSVRVCWDKKMYKMTVALNSTSMDHTTNSTMLSRLSMRYAI